MKHLYHVRRADFVLAAVALLAVLTFETLQALLISVVVSLFALVWHASQHKLAVLGRVPDSLDFTDIRRHPENKTLPGLLMVRPENSLFFANASGIREEIISEVISSTEPVKAVLLDLSATTDLDVPSADMLAELHKELEGRNVRLMLTRVISPVFQMLERSGEMEEIKPKNIFVNPTQAVLDYLSSEHNTASVQTLLITGVSMVRNLLKENSSTAPADQQASLTALVETLDREIKRSGK
jgi:MFS superfamily sulfate permease-like transporter